MTLVGKELHNDSVSCIYIFHYKRKKIFRNTIRVTNSMGPDQARHFVGLDLGPNCLQRLSTDDTSRQRVTQWLSQLYLYIPLQKELLYMYLVNITYHYFLLNNMHLCFGWKKRIKSISHSYLDVWKRFRVPSWQAAGCLVVNIHMMKCLHCLVFSTVNLHKCSLCHQYIQHCSCNQPYLMLIIVFSYAALGSQVCISSP